MVASGQDAARNPGYQGEDVTPTTERELRGWYSYGMAAEVFAVVGVGSFLPVTLEQLARERGVLWSDRSIPCVSAPGTSSLMARAERDPDQCVVNVLGSNVTTASFAMYTFSMAVFVQALVLVSFSAFADHGDNRKTLLLGFGFAGAVASMLFLFIGPALYLLAPLLVITCVACMGSSFVLLNSFLPLLTINHPSTQDVNERQSTTRSHPSGEGDSKVSPGVQSSRISSKGVGLGYCAAVFVQCLSILLLWYMSKISSLGASKTLPLRLVVIMAGLWWFAFTWPAVFWLRKRPGPPLPTVSHHNSAFRRGLSYVVYAWQSLWRTIKTALRLREAAIFLLAWFLLSDAVASVSGTAILFARTELKLGTVAIALLSITATTSGIIGAVVWPIASRKFGWQTNKTIVACMCLMEIIPIYGLLGYLPIIQSLGVGGLQQPWEIYPLGIIHGLVMGGLSSYCRSFFGLLIPPGSEVAFYALFAITDKGSSAIGPSVVGLIVDATGHIRPAFIFLAILIALPAPLIWHVDAKKGQEDAMRMAARLKSSKQSSQEYELRSTRDEEAEGLMADAD